MPLHSRVVRARALLAMCATIGIVAACGGAADATGPGSGNGNGNGVGADGTANDLFVSVSTGNDANTGTRQHPFATIGAALAAADSGRVVRVAGGTYMERVTLRSNLTIVGGFDPATWQRDTGQYPTQVSDSSVAIDGRGVRNVVLDGLRMSTLASSAFGVVVLDSSTGIEIRGGTITAAPGDSAAPVYDASGNVGNPGQGGQGGVAGGICPPDRVGGIGGSENVPGGSTGGKGGTGGLFGGFDGSPGAGTGGGGGGKAGAAYAVGATGKTPTISGAAGAPGIPGASFGSFDMQTGYSRAFGQGGLPGAGGPGGGGGGGGGGNFALATCGGGGGGGGQGGGGGTGGLGGFGGYPSIGVILGTTSELQMDSTVVVTLGGGKGGDGGKGEQGGPGGAGGAGGAGAAGAGSGGHGGTGGPGGRGGQGGGGGGGPSIGLLVVGNGAFNGNAVVFRIGPPGQGGASSSPGLPGDSAVDHGGELAGSRGIRRNAPRPARSEIARGV